MSLLLDSPLSTSRAWLGRPSCWWSDARTSRASRWFGAKLTTCAYAEAASSNLPSEWRHSPCLSHIPACMKQKTSESATKGQVSKQTTVKWAIIWCTSHYVHVFGYPMKNGIPLSNEWYTTWYTLDWKGEYTLDWRNTCTLTCKYTPDWKTLTGKRHKSWTIRPKSFLRRVWPLNLFAFFLLENKSTCGVSFNLLVDKEEKDPKHMRMIIRSPYNSMQQNKVYFVEYTTCLFA